MSRYNNDDMLELDDLIYHYDTNAAYCVSTREDEFGNEAPRIYLAKSLVRKEDRSNGDTIFHIPEWLAIDKDLI